MTVHFDLPQAVSGIKKTWFENSSFYILLLLISILIAVFAFWKPAGEPARRGEAYYQTTTKPDPEQRFESIVASGDAIRSILQ